MNLEATIGYAPPQGGFPAGSAVAGYLVTLTGALPSTPSQSQIVSPGTENVQFPVTIADTYTASIIAVDANNNTFGTAVNSNALSVTGPTTVSLVLPASISLAQTS